MSQAADTQTSSELSRKIQLLQAKLSSESKKVADLTRSNKALKQVGDAYVCALVFGYSEMKHLLTSLVFNDLL